MKLKEYYDELDLPFNSSNEDIKKAYRKKARLYHPDLNPSPDASEMFIRITEAYEFLIAYHGKINYDEQAYKKAMDDWRKYRQHRSRQRATAYARTSYSSFKSTKFYKTTRIFDGTTIIISFVISILVIVYTVYGYTNRLRHPIPGLEKPSVFAFIICLLLGVIFFVVTFFYLKAYQEASRKHKKKS
jgi:hypothetical protein